jgi:hypothetical protein
MVKAGVLPRLVENLSSFNLACLEQSLRALRGFLGEGTMYCQNDILGS